MLDPFASSGTTVFVAQGLHRKCFMIEIDPDYCELIKRRLEGKYGEFKRKTKTKSDVQSSTSSAC
ncbi:site-specific DNA-methyltransferase [candidate division KSB1 bacterium]|nr:site-specific DNA-methyltransferase [candidate division KSB1 bacterium]